MYVWTGKHVPFDRRKKSLRQALELWDKGYDYTGYDINPLCPLIGMNTQGSTIVCKRCKKKLTYCFFVVYLHVVAVNRLSLVLYIIYYIQGVIG
jgi:hypothetical protein